MKRNLGSLSFVVLTFLASSAYADFDPGIDCMVSGVMGRGENPTVQALSSEKSTLARGVDLTNVEGYDFFGFVDGRTDRRVYRLEVYDHVTGNLVTAKTEKWEAQSEALFSATVESKTSKFSSLLFQCDFKR